MLKKLLVSALISATAFSFIACDDDDNKNASDDFTSQAKAIINDVAAAAKACATDGDKKEKEVLDDLNKDLEVALKFYEMIDDACYDALKKAIIEEYNCYKTNFTCDGMLSDSCDSEWDKRPSLRSCFIEHGKKDFDAADAAVKEAFNKDCDREDRCYSETNDENRLTKAECTELTYISFAHYKQCQKEYVDYESKQLTCRAAITSCTDENAEDACEESAKSEADLFYNCISKYVLD